VGWSLLTFPVCPEAAEELAKVRRTRNLLRLLWRRFTAGAEPTRRLRRRWWRRGETSPEEECSASTSA